MSKQSSDAALVGLTIGAKYCVERVLGKGGMGVVVAARHVELDDLRAIKILNADLLGRKEAGARFLREARAMARLRSDHAVRIHDMGKLPDDAPYLVMEYLDGSDLGRMLRSRQGFPLGDAVLYLQQACEAIFEAHEQGIIHRDLKPANIFLTARRDGTACIKVLDFGIAKVFDPEGSSPDITRTDELLGTPSYMAPEQAIGARGADPRSDIWALGVILYELVTGRRPFTGATFIETVTQVLQKEPEPPSALRPELPKGLEQIILTCLNKDPEQRVSSAEMLQRALEPFACVHRRSKPLSVSIAVKGSPVDDLTRHERLPANRISAPPKEVSDPAEPPQATVEQEESVPILIEEMPPSSLPRIPVAGWAAMMRHTRGIVRRRSRLIGEALIGCALLFCIALLVGWGRREPQPLIVQPSTSTSARASASEVSPSAAAPKVEEGAVSTHSGTPASATPTVSPGSPARPARSKGSDSPYDDSVRAPEAEQDPYEKLATQTARSPYAAPGPSPSSEATQASGVPQLSAATGLSGGAPPAFNFSAAQAALAAVSNNIGSCKAPGAESVSGSVSVTFAPNGNVTSATISSGPLMGTTVGGCVAGRFRTAQVPPFSGSLQPITGTFTIP